MAKKPQEDPEYGIILVPIESWNQVAKSLEDINRKLNLILKVEVREVAAIEDLQSEVQANTDLTGSVVRLVDGLADQLEEALANNDTAAVQVVVDQMRSNNQSLADAVAANTQVNPQ